MMKLRQWVRYGNPNIIDVNTLLFEVRNAFLQAQPAGTSFDTHLKISMILMVAVDAHLMKVGDSESGYHKEIEFTVYPQNRLVIVTIKPVDGMLCAVHVPFDCLLAEVSGLTEEILLAHLQPLAQRTRAAMAKVLAAVADLKGHNS